MNTMQRPQTKANACILLEQLEMGLPLRVRSSTRHIHLIQNSEDKVSVVLNEDSFYIFSHYLSQKEQRAERSKEARIAITDSKMRQRNWKQQLLHLRSHR